MPAAFCKKCGGSYAFNDKGVIGYLCHCGMAKELLSGESFADVYLPNAVGVRLNVIDGEAVFTFDDKKLEGGRGE